MNFLCPVCCEEYIFTTRLCSPCSKIKHYCSIYGRDRVYKLLNNVLSREEDKIKNKEKLEIHKEIENLKDKIKPSQIKRGSEVD